MELTGITRLRKRLHYLQDQLRIKNHKMQEVNIEELLRITNIKVEWEGKNWNVEDFGEGVLFSLPVIHVLRSYMFIRFRFLHQIIILNEYLSRLIVVKCNITRAC